MAPEEGRALGIPYYSDAVVAERCAELCALFDDIKGFYAEKLPTVEIELDEDRLFLVVTAYFHDVARYKWWHYRAEDPATARLNDSKKAAYLCYWLNKIAPAHARRAAPASMAIDPESRLPNDLSLLLNAHFALHTATIYLGYPLSKEVLCRLLYELQWRDMSAKACLVIFELLDLSTRGQPLVSREAL